MKILIFTPQIYLLGGAERLAVEFAEDANRRPGVQADVLSMVPETMPGTEQAKEKLLRSGIPSVRFLGRRPRSQARGFATAVRGLRRILVEGEYDVLDTTSMGPATLGCWAACGLRMCHVSGIHAIFAHSRHHGANCRFWRWSCRMSRRTRYYAISEAAAAQWITYAGVGPERVRVVYNSIHESFFEATPDREAVAREFGLDPRRRLLLFVGRLTLGKGLDTLVEAAKPMLAAGRASLLVVGSPNDTPEAEFGETKDSINELKRTLSAEVPGNAVRWVGRREDVPRLMASADLLVHPARHEGFGLVVAESLAAGLPVVATRVGGIPEVTTGTDAVLVEPNAAGELREGIHRILNYTPAEAAAVRRRGLARAEYFRPRRRTDELLGYYANTLDRSGTPETRCRRQPDSLSLR